LDPRLSLLKLASVSSSHVSFPTRALFSRFGSAEEILRASPAEWETTEGVLPYTVRRLREVRDDSEAAVMLARLEEGGMRPVSFVDLEYPENLTRIPDPPPVLFLRGQPRAEDRGAVAVVGARKASAYGIAVCRSLVAGLVGRGVCIVSGLALGIDAAAHWACLERGGRTLGVLGTGLDVPYPKENLPLFQRIPSQGVLISEFPPGTRARPENFPRRNRIISGLSLGVLVVEASRKSGTLITVRMALEQGREVFAVPGDIRSPLSKGTHRLIQQGAKLVDSLEDILEELPALAGREHPDSVGVGQPETREDPRPWGSEDRTVQSGGAAWTKAVSLAGGEEAEQVVGQLGEEGTLIDTLLERTGWPLEKLNGLLTELELLGRVRRLPGNRIGRCVT